MYLFKNIICIIICVCSARFKFLHTNVVQNIKKTLIGSILIPPQCHRILTEEKLIDLDEPSVRKSSSLATKDRSPKPRPAKPENLSQTGQEMWQLLKHKKGLVVIGKTAFILSLEIANVGRLIQPYYKTLNFEISYIYVYELYVLFDF